MMRESRSRIQARRIAHAILSNSRRPHAPSLSPAGNFAQRTGAQTTMSDLQPGQPGRSGFQRIVAPNRPPSDCAQSVLVSPARGSDENSVADKSSPLCSRKHTLLTWLALERRAGVRFQLSLRSPKKVESGGWQKIERLPRKPARASGAGE